MFSNLFDFSYKRSGAEILGFYAAYLVFAILAGMLIGGAAGFLSGDIDAAYAEGVRIGTFVAIILSMTLSFVILKAKKLAGQVRYICLAFLAGVLALIAGSLVGLIIPAYFTSLGIKEKTQKKINNSKSKSKRS